jgi:hypothetical protein
MGIPHRHLYCTVSHELSNSADINSCHREATSERNPSIIQAKKSYGATLLRWIRSTRTTAREDLQKREGMFFASGVRGHRLIGGGILENVTGNDFRTSGGTGHCVQLQKHLKVLRWTGRDDAAFF